MVYKKLESKLPCRKRSACYRAVICGQGSFDCEEPVLTFSPRATALVIQLFCGQLLTLRKKSARYKELSLCCLAKQCLWVSVKHLSSFEGEQEKTDLTAQMMPLDKFADMEEKLWILEDLNMMYIRQIALSLQVKYCLVCLVSL